MINYRNRILLILLFSFQGCVFTGSSENIHSINSLVSEKNCKGLFRIKLIVPNIKSMQTQEGRFRLFDNLYSDSMKQVIISNSLNREENNDNSNINGELKYEEESEIINDLFNIFGIITMGIFPIRSNRKSKISFNIYENKQKKEIYHSEISISWSAYYSIWGGVIYPFYRVEKKQKELIKLAMDKFNSEYCCLDSKINNC